MHVAFGRVRRKIALLRTGFSEIQSDLVLYIHFIYLCMFSSVGASCARDIAKKR